MSYRIASIRLPAQFTTRLYRWTRQPPGATSYSGSPAIMRRNAAEALSKMRRAFVAPGSSVLRQESDASWRAVGDVEVLEAQAGVLVVLTAESGHVHSGTA